MAATQAVVYDQGLSKRMFASSRNIHSLSDALVNAKMIALFGDPLLYARAIGCFYLVFRQLEESLEASIKLDPRLRALQRQALPLYRAAAFEADLRYFLGPSWRQDVETRCRLPEVQSYCSHLRSLAEGRPLSLAAHSFTQHLAVASGGQIISRMVRRGVQLAGTEGTQAFEYAGGSPGALKAGFKERIDALGATLSEEEVQQLIEEHCRAFAFNNAIIKAYRVGHVAPFVGAIRLALGSRTQLALAAAALAAAVLAACVVRSWMG